MDVLSSGPERPGPPPRRWVAVLATVAVAGAAALLAARSTPGGPDAAPTRSPAPVAPSVATDTLPPAVVGVAVGTRYEYALTAECTGSTRADCVYQLHRRDRGQWFPMPLRTAPRGADAPPPLLRATGADAVTVLDEPDTGFVYFSTDGGATVQARPVRPGPPIPAVPAAGVLDLAACAECGRRLTVLEPAVGQLRALSVQPPLGAATLASVDSAGDTIWVVGTRSDGVPVTAVSTDRGRSWRAVPVPGYPPGVDNLLVTDGPGGSAYLLGSRTTTADSGPLAEIWQVDGPAGSWRRLATDRGPLAPIWALSLGRGLLLTDFRGRSWRVSPYGAVGRVPDVQLAALRIGPGFVASGPAGVLVGVPIGENVRNTVLVSTNQGGTWTVEQVAG